jgi:hypothetical protein
MKNLKKYFKNFYFLLLFIIILLSYEKLKRKLNLK